ncbi:hypothetical protein [Agriterribacter sp.]|uniref:hypothetical protein n=1 Tax=Agriterribacter sp. TaxID=2821509 RepID=UPI002B9F0BDB|nr:hypothetical protein [Agriterribacter sp.]HRO48112.1 hypothetical protein [Agriterribacter sp.]HRQ17964.1 hypothetical protein [Agriterribacter sp.]
MNEILLVVLIAFTLITFFTLNKKIGAATSIEQQILQQEYAHPPVSGITRVIYQGMIKEAEFNYGRVWSATAITGMVPEIPNRQNEITVVYHQPGNRSKQYPCYPEPVYGKVADTVTDAIALLPGEAVCVMSSISDFQYRHVLAALDDDME